MERTAKRRRENTLKKTSKRTVPVYGVKKYDLYHLIYKKVEKKVKKKSSWSS